MKLIDKFYTWYLEKEFIIFICAFCFSFVSGLWEIFIVALLCATPHIVSDTLFFTNFSKKHNIFKNSGLNKNLILIRYIFTIVMYIFAFANLYNNYGLIVGGNYVENTGYFYSFYFSLVTWTTLGSGDISPPDTIKLWVAIESLLGYIFMAILIAIILMHKQVELDRHKR